MNRKSLGLWVMVCLLAPAGLPQAALIAPAKAAGKEKGSQPAFVVKFAPGAMTPESDAEVKRAAIYAVEKGRMLQVEGYSCQADGDGGGKPTHRLEQGEKRAESVRGLLIKLGVPGDNVFTIAYGNGECKAVITAY